MVSPRSSLTCVPKIHDAFDATDGPLRFGQDRQLRGSALDADVVRANHGSHLDTIGNVTRNAQRCGREPSAPLLHHPVQDIGRPHERRDEGRRRRRVNLGRRAHLLDLPQSMTTSLSEKSRASSWSCVTMMEVKWVRSCRRRNHSRSSARTRASRAPKGSSSNRSFG